MIPSILWQTWKTKDIPRSVKKFSDSWKTSNPQLKINFMDDQQCSDFILEHFGQDIHDQYHQLPLPINRADFWRLAVVYIYGGYYADLDIECNAKLSSFINPNVDAVWTRELNNISNYFFGAIPKHPVIKVAMDDMLKEAINISNQESINWGMHFLHMNVRKYYNVIETNYISDDKVHFMLDSDVKSKRQLIHYGAAAMGEKDYDSWRIMEKYMNDARTKSNNITFFTTFNRNGYELYGKTWIKTFIKVANYYNKFKAKIYYEGFSPEEQHPNIEWVNYKTAIPHHNKWKNEYNAKTSHSDYVKTMTVRFSHKAFVIQHALDNIKSDYLIWLDGDCIFKPEDYSDFPNMLNNKFLACQMEEAHDLNHIESGILIFDGNHPNTKIWNEKFKENYKVENVLPMGEPYDGFIVYKSLKMTQLPFVNLNENYGKGGIQSDPTLTFLHPEINKRFHHNIGWTGKNQYDDWDSISKQDIIYAKMKNVLFGSNMAKQEQRISAFNKLEALKKLRSQ